MRFIRYTFFSIGIICVLVACFSLVNPMTIMISLPIYIIGGVITRYSNIINRKEFIMVMIYPLILPLIGWLLMVLFEIFN